MKHAFSRFEIWLVNLNPSKGREIAKTRPCVVISPDEMRSLGTVLVAPLTSKGFRFPTRVAIRFQGKQGLVLLDQLRAIDKSRMHKKLGMLDSVTGQAVCRKLQEMFAE